MTGTKPIYLDYAATTPLDPQVSAFMIELLQDESHIGNSSSNHIYGWSAQELIDSSRKNVADLIGCDAREVIWSSGATESNNLAIQGTFSGLDLNSCHAITSQTEHKSILECFKYLEAKGLSVSYLPPNKDGVIGPQCITSELNSNTKLVSLSHINNETGLQNDIDAIGKLLDDTETIFHVDAAQSAARKIINVRSMSIDLLSLSSHKMYGPKGVGCLYVTNSLQKALMPIMFGGGQERGLRPGTLPTFIIGGFGKAAEVQRNNMNQDLQHITSLDKQVFQKLSAIPGFSLNGNNDFRVPGIINCSIEGILNDLLISNLPSLAFSTGSACNSSSLDTSHVLKAMKLNSSIQESSFRLSYGRHTTQREISNSLDMLADAIERLL